MRYIDIRSNRAINFYCQQGRWRQLPPDALAEFINQMRRRAGRGEHLTHEEWALVDRMRRRLVKLGAEAVR